MGPIAEAWKAGLEELGRRCDAATDAEEVSALLQDLILFWSCIREHHRVGRFVLVDSELAEIDGLYAKLKAKHLQRYSGFFTATG